MQPAPQTLGRRERNKQEKLDRITAAARELFTQYGVDEVTTQQVAEKADVGSGTLFLYAKTKAELLLLVHNVKYAQALTNGVDAASAETAVLDAVMAIIRPIIECNRVQIENGRTYLKEIVFGDPAEPHHAEALSLTIRTEEAIAGILGRDEQLLARDPAKLARIITAIMFISMTSSATKELTDAQVGDEIRDQISVLLGA
ncbi:helix-turn-helix domain containing protein [Paenarthrobacter sp. OM7]|uniref:TetR/AcrR family transcriptional regulator n=1 Tax=Paenarthrobacter sp. AMU7 TaxID=3162492 RepID=A0AB39YQR9_9MICC|nr:MULTISPECIES: TetR/AcrR family transcriptional regulator [Micrococcaceae]QSZ48057.1 TetR family transcriptional regulator [Arthrobacter sp. D5-1]WGM21706.1 helix-turn-helix domain containing protein [Paenarthrobacter sp. OM7]